MTNRLIGEPNERPHPDECACDDAEDHGRCAETIVIAAPTQPAAMETRNSNSKQMASPFDSSRFDVMQFRLLHKRPVSVFIAD